jgi:hypothetical protein
MIPYQVEISDVLVKMLYPFLDALHPLESFQQLPMPVPL